MQEQRRTTEIQTPAYVFDEQLIQKNYIHLAEKMADYQLHYALKANAETVVLKTLQAVGANFEIASVLEYESLIDLGVSPDQIICSAPIWKPETIEKLYRRGCRYFVYESVGQLDYLRKHAISSKKIARISILDIDSQGIEFGMTIEELQQVMKPDGVTFYLRDHSITKLNGIFNKLNLVLDTCGCGSQFILNIGGGYNLKLREEFYEHLHRLTSQLTKSRKDTRFTLLAEPGENVVKDAGCIISEVVAIKEKDHVTYVYIDAGMYTGIFQYKGFVSVLNKQKMNGRKKIYVFHDISCSHKRLFIQALETPVCVGDRIVMHNCGAYMSCYRNKFHLFETPVITTYERITHETEPFRLYHMDGGSNR